MNYYSVNGQMDLSDRIAIETGICTQESFKKIAKRLRRHPSTIAHEVKKTEPLYKVDILMEKTVGLHVNVL